MIYRIKMPLFTFSFWMSACLAICISGISYALSSLPWWMMAGPVIKAGVESFATFFEILTRKGWRNETGVTYTQSYALFSSDFFLIITYLTSSVIFYIRLLISADNSRRGLQIQIKWLCLYYIFEAHRFVFESNAEHQYL